ncbi:MAG TPA: NAD(P)H-binding protein [Asanoa sp.]
MKLAVFGATGAIGGHVVRQALDAGHKVTAVVRDASRLRVDDPGLEVVTVPGLTDPAPLVPALDGCDAAITGVGPRRPREVTVASSTTRGILAALERSHVHRFVAVSAVPVGPVPEGESFRNRYLLLPLVGRLLRGIYGDLAVMEDEIMRSDTDWTIVRPPRLDGRPFTGRYRMTIGGNVPGSRVMSKADVAHAMLAALDNPATIRQAVGVSG